MSFLNINISLKSFLKLKSKQNEYSHCNTASIQFQFDKQKLQEVKKAKHRLFKTPDKQVQVHRMVYFSQHFSDFLMRGKK